MKYPIIKKPDQDTTVKLDKTVYHAYSEKKLKGLYPDDNYTVVGEVKPGSNKKQVGELNTGHAISQRGAHSLSFNREEGYLCVGEDTYVVVLRPRVLLWWLLGLALLAVIVLLVLRFGLANPDTRPDAQDDALAGDRIERVEEEVPVEKLEDHIAFTGYGKAVVSEKNPYLELTNPVINTVDFVFTVADKATGEVLAVTESVAPGQYAYVNVMDHFRGTQGGVLIIHTATFASDNSPRSGMDSEVEIEIK
mgnify:CR=1 FL=1